MFPKIKESENSSNKLYNSLEFIKKWTEAFKSIYPDNQYLNKYLENNDHGLPHSEKVYKKSLDILNFLKTNGYQIEVSNDLIELMCVLHDIGRFHHNRCEKKHTKCGVAQVKLFSMKVKIEDKDSLNKLMDFIGYHDFLSKDLDPDQKEPYSFEGQIARVADKISVDPSSEVRRYWDYGKRIGGKLYDPTISIEERLNFSFDKKKTSKTDQLTYFLALLGMTPESISDPLLRKYYKKWSEEKLKAEKEIYKIFEEEGFSIEVITIVKTIIQIYKLKKHLNF